MATIGKFNGTKIRIHSKDEFILMCLVLLKEGYTSKLLHETKYDELQIRYFYIYGLTDVSFDTVGAESHFTYHNNKEITISEFVPIKADEHGNYW